MGQDIVIVGAGIGGLALARALELNGIPFQLYEQADGFEAQGYGIQVSPNAIRVLQQLELEDEVKAISHQCRGFELRSFESDQAVAAWNLPPDTPYYQCRRADLHQLLFESIKDKSRLHFSHRLQSIEQTDSVRLTFQNQATIQAKALVGADGVRSIVRQTLFPQQQTRYAGFTAFRALIPYHDKYGQLLDRAMVWMGKNHHVVAYPNCNPALGKQWINLVLVKKTREWDEESWSTPADRAEMIQTFYSQSPLFNAILHDIERQSAPCFKWGLFEHDPLPYWSKGRLTLLGDAAHPMLPFMAQGAAIAIEDAYVVAKYLTQTTDAAQAFQAYQQSRMARTAQIQHVSRKNADVFHASGSKAWIRNVMFSLVSAIRPSLIHQKYNWIYQFDATTTDFVSVPEPILS